MLSKKQKRLVKGIKIFLKKKKKKRQYAYVQYRNLSEEEKERKHQYGGEQYKNLQEDEKQRLAEYIKKLIYNAKINAG